MTPPYRLLLASASFADFTLGGLYRQRALDPAT